MTRPLGMEFDEMMAAEQEVFTRTIMVFMQEDHAGIDAAIERMRTFAGGKMEKHAEAIQDGVARLQFRATFWESFERLAANLRDQIEGTRIFLALVDEVKS